MTKRPLKLLLSAPRGFCAGVERAIQIVEGALEKYGPPVYVRHEIVHNRFVVERLERMGAVFVKEVEDVPDGCPVIFSAHGVPKSVPASARARDLTYLDATCPLVSKVHKEAERHFREGRHILLIGHAGHPEVVGTLGQLPDGAITLIEDEADAAAFTPGGSEGLTPEGLAPEGLAYVTQTTLSVDDTKQIIEVLQRRFPAIAGPRKEDICYATTNRQDAVKEIAARCDCMVVVGAPNSSNANRLVEVALRAGARDAVLVQRAAELDWARFSGAASVGLTAGASAPEVLVQEVISAFGAEFDITIEEVETCREDVVFKLPRALTA